MNTIFRRKIFIQICTKKLTNLFKKNYQEKQFKSLEQILTELNISYEMYILAVRSTIKKRKIFLKRKLEEIYLNNYMKDLVHVWNANHDIQYVRSIQLCSIIYVTI